MRYATILFAVLLSSCGEAKTSSKNATPEDVSLSAVAPSNPATVLDTVLEHVDKGDGLIVDVLQSGTGRVVQLGDTVTLDYTISYVPSATAKSDAKADAKSEKGSKDAKESKSAPKHDAKKPARKHADAKADDPAVGASADEHHKESSEKGDAAKDEAAKKDTSKTDTNKSDETRSESAQKDTGNKDAEKADTEKADTAKKDTETKDIDAKTGTTKETEKPVSDKSDTDKADAAGSDAAGTEATKPKPDEKSGEKAKTGEHDTTKPTTTQDEQHAGEKAGQVPPKAGEKPADAKPAEALEPVIVASTKSMLAPFTVKLSNNAKPKLMPGLVRGLEGLKVGTHARITVPAALAYGKDGNTSSGIPAETPVQIDVVIVESRE